MAKLLKKPAPGPWKNPDLDVSALGKLIATSDQVKVDKGIVKDIVLRLPAEKGFALYLVTKQRPLTIAHIPYRVSYNGMPPGSIPAKVPNSYIEGLTVERIIAMEMGRRLARILFPKAAR